MTRREEKFKGKFKVYKTVSFKDMKITGMYEQGIKPVEFIANISFSIAPTEFALKNNEPSDFKFELKNKLSLFKIDKYIKSIPLQGWIYDGSRYTFGHDYSNICLSEQVSSLGIDLYFIQEDRTISPIFSRDETKKIDVFQKEIVKKISDLKMFSSSLFEIFANRKRHEIKKNQY
jgi:hypothetical protein